MASTFEVIFDVRKHHEGWCVPMTFETFSHTYLHIPPWCCFSALRIMPHAQKPSTQQDNGYSIINNTYVLLQWAISLFAESGLRSRLSHLHELVLILQFTSNHLVVFHKIINEYNCIYRIVLKNQFVWVVQTSYRREIGHYSTKLVSVALLFCNTKLTHWTHQHRLPCEFHGDCYQCTSCNMCCVMVILHRGSDWHLHTWVLGEEGRYVTVFLRRQRAKERPEHMTHKILMPNVSYHINPFSLWAALHVFTAAQWEGE